MFIKISKQKIYNTVFLVAVIIAVFSCANSELYRNSETSAPLIYGKTIIIDPGHGSPDSGAVGHSGSYEKDINLSVSLSLGNLLQQSGANVIYTRESDGNIADNPDDTIRNIKRNDMSKRKNIRDNSNADMFISIHMNKFSMPQYKGAQVFYKGNNTKSKLLAECIQKQIAEFADSTNNRLAKDSKNDIYILNDSKIPAVLVECGFLSNPEEEQKLLTQKYQDEISYAIYSGILKYLHNI